MLPTRSLIAAILLLGLLSLTAHAAVDMRGFTVDASFDRKVLDADIKCIGRGERSEAQH